MQISKTFALDLIDWLHIWGNEWVTPHEWCARFRTDARLDTATRSWERVKQRLSKHGVPHETADYSESEGGRKMVRVRLLKGAKEFLLEALPPTTLESGDK